MIKKMFSISVCTSSFLYTSYVMYNLMHFLSRHNVQKTPIRYHTGDSLILQSLWALLIDASLLSAFMLQHSLMKHDFVKQMFTKLHLEDIERSVYNACSAGVLYLLINKWILVPQISIWSVDTSTNNTLWLVFTILHVVGWCIIYSGCLIMDISELAGLKQVYYTMSGRSSPMLLKSRELQRYFIHMRHPSFTGFFIILWMHPFMTMDRVLLGLILTVYMILMWTIDEEDYDYHVKMIKQKQRERW